MKIFDRAPTDWRDLQNLVGQLFVELGCDVKVGEKVQLVRGEKEIDVQVADHSTVPLSCYLCECKYWKKRVDQEVVHAFRTVMADQGAHRGFIISIVNFQKGAHCAVENTNTHLFTFAQLQETFFERWRLAMAKRHKPAADVLSHYWDPIIGILPQRKFDPKDREVMEILGKANQPLIALGSTVLHRGGEVTLPMTIPVLDDGFVQVGEFTISSYRQFYDWIEANKDVAVRAYRRHMGLDSADGSERKTGDQFEPRATDAIAACRLPPLPSFESDDRVKADSLAAEYDEYLQEIVLSSRNVHRGQHLRFVRTAGYEWHVLQDVVYPDGTANITVQTKGTIFRCHHLDDGEGTHHFLTWYFIDQMWRLEISEHSMAFEDDLHLTLAELQGRWEF